MKNQSIDLFSVKGIAILISIVAPIFAIVIASSYFPREWVSLTQSLGLVKADTPTSSNPAPIAQVIAVPDLEPCRRSYVSVKLDTFEQCLVDGMSYVDVANTLGYPGTLASSSGSTEIWQWNDGGGKYLTAVFINGKMASKSQLGLD